MSVNRNQLRRLVPRILIVGCLASVTAGAVTASPARGDDLMSIVEELLGLTTEERLFAPDSVWNKPLSPNAPLDPSSDVLVASLNEDVQQDIESGTGPWIATKSYSTPLYRVPAGHPTVKVTLDDGDAPWRAALQDAFEEVPIPPGAKPARGTDGHMTVWQPSTDRLWEFWRARQETDGWHASWGGAIENVSQSPGYYTAQSWPGASHHWGATATGLSVIGGVMTLEEFEAGEVDHALALNIPFPRAEEYSWPAQDSDGTLFSHKAIPEGAWFRIDPKLNLDELTMHPVTRMMAEAVQKYGMIVRDKTGDAVGFAAEDPTPTGTNPYREPDGGYFRGKSPSQFLRKFPWKHLQLLEMSICTKQSEPCPPPG